MHASSRIETSSCTFPGKPVHLRFCASPCKSVQGGLHILSVQVCAGGPPNCAGPCRSVQAQSSCCNVCKSCLQSCRGEVLVCLAWWHGCRLALFLRTMSLFLGWFPCTPVHGGLHIQSVHLHATGHAGISSLCESVKRSEIAVL